MRAKGQTLRREEEGSVAGRTSGEDNGGRSSYGDDHAEHAASAGQNERLARGGPGALLIAVAGTPPGDELANADQVGGEGGEQTERGPTQAEGRSRRRVGNQQRSLDQVTGIPSSKDQRVRQHLEQHSPHAERLHELVHQ
jgi:hypothetical protein